MIYRQGNDLHKIKVLSALNWKIPTTLLLTYLVASWLSSLSRVVIYLRSISWGQSN